MTPLMPSDEELCSTVEWDPEQYGIGVKHIDEQHKHLIVLVDKLGSLFHTYLARMRQREGLPAKLKNRNRPDLAFQVSGPVAGVVSSLVTYCAKHLTAEDHLLESFGYADRAVHCAEHEAFVREVMRAYRLVEEQNADADDLRRLLRFLKTWIDEHIPNSDRQYAPLLLEKGIAA